jgi:hypothetical protein
MKYLALNNASVSLLFDNSLYTVDAIDPDSVFTTIGFPLVSLIKAPFTTLDMNDPHHGAVLKVMRKARQQACFNLAANHHPLVLPRLPLTW